MNITVRRSEERGHANHGWLDTYHSFSFADYYDPNHMGFRDLRVINDDVINPAAGFPTHGHNDMEIISYIVRGSLAHKDTTGGQGVIERGDVQTMTAGGGVRHSEFNASKDKDVRLIQIWVMPQADGLTPAYAQAHFTDEDKHNNLRLLVGPKGSNSPLTVNQDVYLYGSILDANQSVDFDLKPERGAWVQVVDGQINVNDNILKAGDAVAVEDVSKIYITAQQPSEFLLFDLV